MSLDDLMAVWRAQDAAPLHGVNETLLRLALRQDEAELQKRRRRERWIVYVFGAGMVAAMLGFLSIMIVFQDRKMMSGWDFALGIGGAAAALHAAGAMYLNHRTQARREQDFGESLREQLNRRIAQLDDQATSASRTSLLVTTLLGGFCPAVILFLSWRINQKSPSDDGYMLISMLLVCAWAVVSGVWELQRAVRRDILPRKRRLEALLVQFEVQ
jgi:peptidoglycan/LPS O-acetylase OafA/YrhL